MKFPPCLFPWLLAVFVVAATALAEPTTKPDVPLPRLHVDGQKIAGPDGKPITLRGVNLGNWLLLEPGVFGKALGDFPDQYTLFKGFHDRFGEAGGDALVQAYRDNFITERDIAAAQRFGVNLLRVGFDYSLFEDDAHPMELRPDAFRYTDRVLWWAEKYGMYVLFDLHGAQGRQSAGKATGQAKVNAFWDDPKDQERSLWLWQEIVKHYKGRRNVLGYEGLNEPWGKTREALRDYVERWYHAVRPLDEETILVFPGWTGDVTFYGPPAGHGFRNVAFDMHFYPGLFGSGKPLPETHRNFLTKSLPRWRDTMAKMNAPLIIGETKVIYPGPGTAEMTRRYQDYCAAQGWPMVQWTWKELTRQSASPTGHWMLATNGIDLPELDLNTAPQEQIRSFFESLGTMPLRLDEELLHWMTTTDHSSPFEPM